LIKHFRTLRNAKAHAAYLASPISSAENANLVRSCQRKSNKTKKGQAEEKISCWKNEEELLYIEQK